jgi:hypothetical protein
MVRSQSVESWKIATVSHSAFPLRTQLVPRIQCDKVLISPRNVYHRDTNRYGVRRKERLGQLVWSHPTEVFPKNQSLIGFPWWVTPLPRFIPIYLQHALASIHSLQSSSSTISFPELHSWSGTQFPHLPMDSHES